MDLEGIGNDGALIEIDYMLASLQIYLNKVRLRAGI
jgi:hypothetical protein